MATRTAPKLGRPTAKGTLKTPGKDQLKGEKQPTSVLEIVPGRFNETDWISLLENDEFEKDTHCIITQLTIDHSY